MKAVAPDITPHHRSRRAPLAPTGRWAIFVVAVALAAGCGGDKRDKAATQAVAKVNKEEITVHQLNAVLAQQRTVPSNQSDQASRRALERLIDQELAAQRAEELKVDRDPKVVQAIELARREIIARAYGERLGESAPRPTREEVRKYYDDHPALFRERRVYQLQEIAIQVEPEKVDAVRTRLLSSKSANEFIEYLKSAGLRFSGTQALLAAEQVPLNLLPTLAGMRDGQMSLQPTPSGANVLVLVSSQPQPVDAERAAPAIEQFLLNERKRKILAEDLKALRASAKIEYVGAFAGVKPLDEAPVSVPAVAIAASAAAAAARFESIRPVGAADVEVVKKELGLK